MNLIVHGFFAAFLGRGDMRYVALVFAAGIALLGCSGCAMYRAPVQPPQGAFTSVEAPTSTNFNESTPAGTQTGRSSAHSILWLVAWGDASVDAAATNGQLSTINHVDYRYLSILGLYTKYTTIAHGK